MIVFNVALLEITESILLVSYLYGLLYKIKTISYTYKLMFLNNFMITK